MKPEDVLGIVADKIFHETAGSLVMFGPSYDRCWVHDGRMGPGRYFIKYPGKEDLARSYPIHNAKGRASRVPTAATCNERAITCISSDEITALPSREGYYSNPA